MKKCTYLIEILAIAFLPVAAHLCLAHSLELFTLAGVWEQAQFLWRTFPAIEPIILGNIVVVAAAVLKEELLLLIIINIILNCVMIVLLADLRHNYLIILIIELEIRILALDWGSLRVMVSERQLQKSRLSC